MWMVRVRFFIAAPTANARNTVFAINISFIQINFCFFYWNRMHDLFSLFKWFHLFLFFLCAGRRRHDKQKSLAQHWHEPNASWASVLITWKHGNSDTTIFAHSLLTKSERLSPAKCKTRGPKEIRAVHQENVSLNPNPCNSIAADYPLRRQGCEVGKWTTK